MTDSYDHTAIEQKWSAHWRAHRTFELDLTTARRPYYNLMMFPYPSAEGLHMGNLFSYIGSDIHGRFRRALGYDVFEPIGFDAFGIHSENFALKVGRHPRELIPANVANFRRQLRRIGAIFDWSHEVDTTDPSYYRWTQWLFLRLFDAGLVYRKEAPVNWCPSCRTVLAAEQAAGGSCERCDTGVEQRLMFQWFARISRFADRLLSNLDWIDWSEITKHTQRQWIGRSEGTLISFPLEGRDESIDVFTTRPDTLWGATYLVLAPEHSLVSRVTTAEARQQVEAYQRASSARSLMERQQTGERKTGVFTGACVIHPATGSPIPVGLADYVIMGYGTGAIMAVPAHDRRDFDFATAMGLPIHQVIEDGESAPLPFEGEGRLVNSGPFSGCESVPARESITAWLENSQSGHKEIQYRLRDWCLSRQRYWGPPIPIVHCDDCGPVRVADEDLPVILPDLTDYAPDGSGRSPLARCEQFVNTRCPTCQRPARRETDVSDNFLDSAWYFLRYPCSHRDDVPFDPAALEPWLPVHMYVGGNEHAVLHLMYTRFLTMALHDLGILPFKEPFRRFRANGVITRDGAKMSKSKGNVVSPDELLDRYGADTVRAYLMFSGNFQEGGDFQEGGIHGVRRFLVRLWKYACETDFSPGAIDNGDIERTVHQTIAKVTRDLEEMRYNTAIPALMELLNALSSARRHYIEAVRIMLHLLSPFAPFITEELWQRVGAEGKLADTAWPVSDPAKARAATVTVVVQVDGKVRARLQLPAGTAREDVEACARRDDRVTAWLQGSEVARTVYVPDRLLNFVIRSTKK